jgi:hypothetical protein
MEWADIAMLCIAVPLSGIFAVAYIKMHDTGTY